MTEQKYDPKKYALELGFTETDAIFLAGCNADATNIRRVARAKGLLPEQKETGAHKKARGKAESKVDAQAKAKARAEAKEAERIAQAAKEAEEEADQRPSYEGQEQASGKEESAEELAALAAEVGEEPIPSE